MKNTSLIVLVVAICVSGCGTVCNLAGGLVHPDSEPRIYGGVIRDLDIIEKVWNEPAPSVEYDGGGDNRGLAYVAAAIISIAVLDPVVSLVADTLTLPITIPLQERRIAREHQREAGASSTSIPASYRPNPETSDTSQQLPRPMQEATDDGR